MAVMVHLSPEVYEKAEKLRDTHEEKLKAYLEARREGTGKVSEAEVRRLFEEERLARRAWEDFYEANLGWKSTPEE